MSEKTFNVKMESQTRKLMEGESRLYDQACPKCGLEGMIFYWNPRERKYEKNGRCASLTCKHGN